MKKTLGILLTVSAVVLSWPVQSEQGPELLMMRIGLPIKKSKVDQVNQVCFDIWGPDANEYGKKHGMTGTNWANSGWFDATNRTDTSATSAVYCVTMDQTKYRATPAKKNEWKTLLGGVDVDITNTYSFSETLEAWNLTPVEAP